MKSLKRICREMLGVRIRPSLNHGDLRLKNVIADEDGKIRAIIDWEKATSNIAPYWELSAALHDPGIDDQERFIEGYGLKPKRVLEIAPYVKAFNLLNYTDDINRALEAKDKRAIAGLRLRFSGALDLYSI